LFKTFEKSMQLDQFRVIFRLSFPQACSISPCDPVTSSGVIEMGIKFILKIAITRHMLNPSVFTKAISYRCNPMCCQVCFKPWLKNTVKVLVTFISFSKTA